MNVDKTANTNPTLNIDLKIIFDAVESSANRYLSELGNSNTTNEELEKSYKEYLNGFIDIITV